MLKLAHPIYTVSQEGGRMYPLNTTMQVEDFFVFANYTDMFGQGYDVLYDL